MPNRMLALWTFKQKADQKVIMKIGEQIIVPFRDRLAPKTISYNWEVDQVLSLGR